MNTDRIVFPFIRKQQQMLSYYLCHMKKSVLCCNSWLAVENATISIHLYFLILFNIVNIVDISFSEVIFCELCNWTIAIGYTHHGLLNV